MRSKVYAGLIGAGAALALVVLVGAVYGAVAGLPPYDEEYGRVKGLDGALLGFVVFSIYGSIPALVMGSLGGVFASRRAAGVKTGRLRVPNHELGAEPNAAPDPARM